MTALRRLSTRPIWGPPARPAHRAFTLIELLVVIAIIAILASLLLPSISRAKASAVLAKCKSNTRQIGIALTMYVGDFGCYPAYVLSPPGFAGPVGWSEVTRFSHVIGGSEKQPFACPSRQGSRQFDGQQWTEMRREYGYNATGYSRSGVPVEDSFYGLGGKIGPQNFPVIPVKESDVSAPAEMIAIGDALGNGPNQDVIEGNTYLMRRESPAGSFQGPMVVWQAFARSAEARHGRRANIGFTDNHVEARPFSTLFLSDRDPWLRQWNRDHKPHR